jgi:iron-sulfur cluster repair protein YtfE (RIC family)
MAPDFTAMCVMHDAMHDALRRELVHLDRITTSVHIDMRSTLTTAEGWRLFKQALRAHRAAEDGTLWPVLREQLALARRSSDLALLAALEAEHEAIDSLVAAVDALAALPDGDPFRLGELVDALVIGVAGHLKHEEDAVLPLARQILTVRLWEALVQAGTQPVELTEPRLLPWLLDGADARTADTLLAPLPESAREAYVTEWLPAYQALERWSPGAKVD